ncbi:MAG: hypothetical protein WB756_00355 [Xanthobacteraceae bacterium]
MRLLLTFAFASAASLACAMVAASDAVARRVALIVGSRGNFFPE